MAPISFSAPVSAPVSAPAGRTPHPSALRTATYHNTAKWRVADIERFDKHRQRAQQTPIGQPVSDFLASYSTAYDSSHQGKQRIGIARYLDARGIHFLHVVIEFPAMSECFG